MSASETPNTAPSNPGDDTKQTEEFISKTGGILSKGAHQAGVGIRLVWHDPLLGSHLVDRLVTWLQRTFPSGLFDFLGRFMARLGYVALVAAVPLVILYGAVAAIRGTMFSIFMTGLGAAIVLVVLQYVAHKMLAACEQSVRDLPTVLKSDGYTRCIAVLNEVAALFVFIGFTVYAIREKSGAAFWEGLGLALALDAVAYLALHPSLVTLTVDPDALPGEETIGILSFFAKAFLRLLPIVFGLATAVGAFYLLLATINVVRNRDSAVDIGKTAMLISGSALLPLAAWIAFALFSLWASLVRAILSLRSRTPRAG